MAAPAKTRTKTATKSAPFQPLVRMGNSLSKEKSEWPYTVDKTGYPFRLIVTTPHRKVTPSRIALCKRVVAVYLTKSDSISQKILRLRHRYTKSKAKKCCPASCTSQNEKAGAYTGLSKGKNCRRLQAASATVVWTSNSGGFSRCFLTAHCSAERTSAW